ncbi:MAG: DUF2087 domain-containing protein [Spirochaetaceae bacterium]|jgi:hypothetical protein|nr:DUF2087 domain-containing protein [Spirochaetaceae bacterium]
MEKDIEDKLNVQINSLPLSEQEKSILKMRFGIGVENSYTVEKLMYTFNLTKDRIRQIELRLLWSLRHQKPRHRKLKDYLDKPENEENEIELFYRKLDKEIIIEKKYTEKEINEIIKKCCVSQDHISFRRELIEKGYLSRTNDCREYWRNIKYNGTKHKGT